MLKKDYDLFKRVIVSLVLVSIFSLIIYFSHIFYVKIFVISFILLFSLIASFEFQNLLRQKNISFPSYLLYVFTAAVVVSVFWFSPRFSGVFFIIFLSLIFLGFYYFNKIDNALPSLSSSFFSLCYIGFPLGLTLVIMYPPPENVISGKVAIFYLLTVTKITDVGAYFIGKYLGKKSLAKYLSPKKTYEGLVGGSLFAIVLSSLFTRTSIFASTSFPLFYALSLGLGLAVFGQIGDLVESLLKRDAAVKDSNRIPGLGGVLDIIDSLIFTTPLFYFFINFT